MILLVYCDNASYFNTFVALDNFREEINMQPIYFVFLITLLITSNAFADGLSAQLDRNRIAEGETVVLTLTAPGDTTETPDLTPLRKDFDILNQSQSTRMTIINGRSDSTHEWQLVLAPKKMGKLTIPAIQMGGTSSARLALEVLPASQADQLGASSPVLLEVEAEPKSAYVQSHIERKYAIFPQHSGTLEINAPLLSAEVPEQNKRGSSRHQMFGRDPFADMRGIFGQDPFFFGHTRTVQLRGRNLSLNIQPQPSGTPSPWLPAESLTLSESWSPDPPQFHVGEPVTRTITIAAKGITASQLPELRPAVPQGVKVYPDKSQTETQSEANSLTSQKVLKSALVPSQSGELILPEVRLSWWDTKANKQRIATLPEHKVQVIPMPADMKQAQVEQVTTEAKATPMPTTPATQNSSAEQRNDEGNSKSMGYQKQPSYWPWIAAIMFLGWLITTILWLRARSTNQKTITAESQPQTNTPNTKKALERFRQACLNNDPKTARQTLLEWAAARWPMKPPQRLEMVGQCIGIESLEILQEMDRCIYAGAAQTWDGEAAWSRLSPLLTKREKQSRNDTQAKILPPLYPQGI
ncbi:MAG: BatD family protein [Candidatus Thiodiazotropha sp.]